MRRTLSTGALVGALLLLPMSATGADARVTAPRSAPVATVELPPAAEADVRLSCADRPGWRFIDLQSWWIPRGDPWPGNHVHAGACWPMTGTVSGIFRTDVLVQGHHQPAGATLDRVRAKDAGKGDVWYCTPTKAGCPTFAHIDANGDLAQWFPLSFDTAPLTAGFHEIQLAAVFGQPGNFDQFATSGLPLQVRSVTTSSRNYFEARGWYPGFNYDNARIKSGIPLTPVPDAWRPTVQCATPSGTGTITKAELKIGMRAHDGFMGIDVPMADNETAQTPTIDTSGLSGEQKLAIICSVSGNLSGHDGTNSGVLVIPFTPD